MLNGCKSILKVLWKNKNACTWSIDAYFRLRNNYCSWSKYESEIMILRSAESAMQRCYYASYGWSICSLISYKEMSFIVILYDLYRYKIIAELNNQLCRYLCYKRSFYSNIHVHISTIFFKPKTVRHVFSFLYNKHFLIYADHPHEIFHQIRLVIHTDFDFYLNI